MVHPFDGNELQLQWRWTDARQRLAGAWTSVWGRATGDDPGTDEVWLAPGAYALEVASSAGLRARARVRVGDLAADAAPIHLEFR
jgi:hypothetical protein